MKITPEQLTRLQTLYSQLAAREIGVDKDRTSRIRWATERLQKPVTSFSALSLDDARYLIDSIQAQLNVKAPFKGRLDRDQARRAGLDGRKDGKEYSDAPQLVTANEIALINSLREQLGWTEDGLRNFLESTRSPLAKRANKAILTTGDANRVIWGLKRIARRKGVWKDRAA